jgi:hypothetical protein
MSAAPRTLPPLFAVVLGQRLDALERVFFHVEPEPEGLAHRLRAVAQFLIFLGFVALERVGTLLQAV